MRTRHSFPLFLSLSLGLLGAGCGSDTNGGVPNGDQPDLGGASGSTDLATLGPADMAQPPPPADPGQPGPFKTCRFDITVPVAQGFGGNVTTTVLGPSDDGTTLSNKNTPFPTVVFSPGFSVDRNAYSTYTTRLASHGFLVITQTYRNAGDHTQNRDDTIKVIDWYLNPTGQDAARVAGRVDASRLGTAGHSLGGKVSFLVAEGDPRVKAAFGVDPVNSPPPFGQAPSAITGLGAYKGATGFLGETLSQGGFMPCAPASDNFQKFLAAAAAPSFAITFANAAHNDFVDMGACPVCSFACPGSKGMQAQTLALASKYAVAFFRRHLLGDAAQQDYLTGAAFQKDAATGAVSVQTK